MLLSEFAPIRKKNIIKPFEIIHRVQEMVGICDYVRNPPIRREENTFRIYFPMPLFRAVLIIPRECGRKGNDTGRGSWCSKTFLKTSTPQAKSTIGGGGRGGVA